jgi:hypothetical protein
VNPGRLGQPKTGYPRPVTLFRTKLKREAKIVEDDHTMRRDGFRFNARGVVLFVVLAAATALAAGGRHLIKKIPVPGDYGWDYLTADSEARRLYVSTGKSSCWTSTRMQ